MSFLGKSYKLDSSENFDEYMKVFDVNVMLRKIGNSTKPTVTLTEKNGTYTLTISSTFKTHVLEFKLGEEIDEVEADGRKVKTTFSMQGNVLTQVQKGEKTATITRTFSDTELKTILSVDDVVCTRIFKVVN